MWSFARQQKYDFCPRAFYFRYKELDEAELSPELHGQVLDIRHESYSHTSHRYLLNQLVKDTFYGRPESFYEVKKSVFRNTKKFELSESEIEHLFESLESFYESEFYRETNPALVNHVQLEEVPSFQIGDSEVLGAVHLAWISGQGQFQILKISSSTKFPQNSFAVLYAMKKFQVVPEKLNVGFLPSTTWECSWNPIDWHDVSELQDKALSFNSSEGFADFPRTEHISRCDICEYSRVCYAHSSELDSI